MNTRSIAFMFALQTMVFSTAFAENLVSNPGFEEGLSPWVENNWQHNDVQYLRDKDRPHSGSYSFMMHFMKAIGGGNSAFFYPNPPFQPSQVLKISYWARGISNGPPLLLRIRKGSAPYTTYFQAESLLTEDWQEFSYTVCLPSTMDTKDCQLFFYTTQVGKIWLDDVSVTELPPIQPGEPPEENPIRNASFEAGRDGWTATFRKREFDTLWEESGGNYPSPDNASLNITEAADAPDGHRYLSFDIASHSRVFLSSAYFPARYGHSMLLRFSLKSDATREFQVGVGSGKNGNYLLQGRTTLKSSGQWQDFSLPVTLKAGLGGVYFVEFEFNHPGHYDLDAVSLTEHDHPPATLFPSAVAIEPTSEAPAGHLYELRQNASFKLRVAGEKTKKTIPFEITVHDFLDREIDRKIVNLTPDIDGQGEASFTMPTEKYGAFRIEARSLPSPQQQGFRGWLQRLFDKTPPPPKPGHLLAEQIYSVLPQLPPPAERPESFFGGHVDLTPYNLEIARKAGFRWLRLYPPLTTQWMAVERAPGKWTFHTSDVLRAKSLGFQILGNLGTCPDFAADIDPTANTQEKSRWRRSFVPADLHRWKDYVTRTFNAFHPLVDAWEIWNEPDGDYMRFRPALDRATVYLSLLQAAREALQATGKPAFILGPAVASINAQMGWQVLEKGGGQFLDAFSFHYYQLAAGGNNPDPSYLTPLLIKYQTFKNRHGIPMPLWHTEGGAYINGSQSWLQTYRIPPSSTVTPSQAAASMVRTALFLKASGVKRYFDYQVGASKAGRRVREDITDGFIDVTGIPSPGIAAHAAMVSLVEDARPEGFETRLMKNHSIRIAHFSGPLEKIDVYWSDTPTTLPSLNETSRKVDVRDMMGNPLPSNNIPLSEFPIYVRESLRE